jgi:hypothetical protein
MWVIGAGRILRIFQYLSKGRAGRPNIKSVVLLVFNRTDRSSFNNDLDSKSASLKESLNLPNCTGLPCLWDARELNNNGPPRVVLESTQSFLGSVL